MENREILERWKGNKENKRKKKERKKIMSKGNELKKGQKIENNEGSRKYKESEF